MRRAARCWSCVTIVAPSPSDPTDNTAAPPLVNTINAPGGTVLAVETNTGTINANTYITYASGARLERMFAAVPAPGPPLVGRSELFAELRTRVTRGGLQALHGLPGAGKTALALALVYDEATLEYFSGGILWAGLGPKANMDGILSLWSTALGVNVSAALSTDERAQFLNAHLQHALSSKPFLLVLDDAWRWEDVAPFRHFTARGSALLLTTRDAGLARRFSRTPPVTAHELCEDAAVELLARACPEALEADAAAFRELARAVGGLPLALVLMGAELATHASQPRWVRAALKRLDSAETRLALQDDQLRPGISGLSLSLRAVIELSLDALPDEASRTAFDVLAVFASKPADFSREAILAIWNVEEAVGDGQIETLYQRGILEATGEDRFTLHQVLASVATARFVQNSDVAARHFAYYRDFVQRNEAWSSIETELPQIRQAWAWVSQAPGQEADCLDLLWAMRLFMERRGLGTEQLAWYHDGLRAARSLGRRAGNRLVRCC
jgi:hypothetical protein